MAKTHATPAPEAPERDFITLQEAAEFLGCSVKFIREGIDRGTLRSYRFPGTRLIRVKRSELETSMQLDNAVLVEIASRTQQFGGDAA